MELHGHRPHKSLGLLATIEVPDFVVITGENGAGKTQLLEAISEQAVTTSYGGNPESVRYLTSEQLGSPQEFQGGEESRDIQVARLEATVRRIDNIRGAPGYQTDEEARRAVHSFLGQLGLGETGILALEAANPTTPLMDWSHEDFARHTPIDFGALNPFEVKVGDIFSRYNQMLMHNNVNRFLASEGSEVPYQTTAEFEAEFGRPPWELFNSALERVGLRYRFEPPTLSLEPLREPPILIDPVYGTRLNVLMLSTGERALLSIASSVYSVTSRAGLMRMPRVILLDEPDATLHPSMIRSLITLLVDDFVKDLGIAVIMTTHSPTTVALAPEDSLYVMKKDSDPRLKKAESKDYALSHLLVGVPTISVSAENRRVVVVESHHDERRYTEIAAILQGELPSERSLVFMAASGARGSNGIDTVVDLVSRLRANGNVLVWGLIDRDAATVEPHTHIFFNAERYTVENFLFDPLSIGLLLLSTAHPRATKALSPSYVGFVAATDGQNVADFVTTEVWQEGDDNTPVSVRYLDGLSLALPKFWLASNGKDIADRVVEKFPELNSFKGREGIMDAVIDRIWSNRHGVIPTSVATTFERLLS